MSRFTLSEVAHEMRSVWESAYPEIAWATRLDGNLFHVAGTRDGRHSQRTVTPDLADTHGLTQSIDTAMADIAREIQPTFIDWADVDGQQHLDPAPSPTGL